MENIRIAGRKGSKAVKMIVDETSIGRYLGNKHKTDAIINYGLAGDHLRAFYRRFPESKKLPMINANVGYSKLTAVRRAGSNKILVPESKPTLARNDNVKDFIEKRTNSIGGIGIRQAKGKGSISGKYYQQFISNRKFELRVHAFAWTDNWPVQKRVGPADAIAWNFKQGGHFITVRNPGSYKTFIEAREISAKILDILNMSFGAVDFIVDTDHHVYFIEINSGPGFTNLSGQIYFDAFTKLKKLNQKAILNLR
jgi:hypothetical protein